MRWFKNSQGIYVPRRTTKLTGSLRSIGMEASSQNVLPPVDGIPLGIVLGGLGEIFHFHPWVWMIEKYIQTLSFIITGGKGGGKSVLLRLLIFYLVALAQGQDRGNAIYDNMRNDYDQAEDEFLLQVWGERAARIPVATAHINPFDYRLKFGREKMLRWLVTAIYDLTGKRFEVYEINILSAMMRGILERDATLLNPGTLAHAVSQFRYRDYTDHFARHRRELAAELGGELGEAHGEKILSQVLREGNSGYAVLQASRHDEVEIERTAGRLADLLIAALLEGLSGEVFGNNGSLPELIDGKVYVSQDMTGLDPALGSAYHFMARLYTAGRFDIIGQDETSKSWGYASWAAAEADQEWQIRGQNPVIFRVLQELAQLETVGDDGAQNVKQAITSIRGAGAHFIMPGQSRQAYMQLRDILQLSDPELSWLLGLDPNTPGVFGFRTRGENNPFLACQLDLVSPVEVDLAAGNKSLHRRLDRYHNYHQRLEEIRDRVAARTCAQAAEVARRKELAA